ncbi:tail fiber assembly protein [Gilliamella sp. WF3-4]|uniref:tail fiber assembly protein n=1 Tax=Gilliamella sp. WF3-4 TaxID=3120255 RepID=UPI00080DB48B|nr:tail fiber assembly protein [Gilliamella apicola]OCG19619.1 hypothetical protein A9G47_00465 [Gilliamella apicola]
MKYQLQPEIAVLDKNGLTVKAGYAVIYNFDALTGEYKKASYQYLQTGVGVPANSCIDAPKSVEDKAIVRQDNKWVYLNDYRGKKIYSIENGAESTVTEIGDIPKGHTLLKPSSEFDVWNGDAWVLDENKQHQHDVDVASAQKKQLLNEATAQIDYLQDAIDTEIATDEEKALYSAWKKYRALLNRIDVDTAPAITWPEKPE